MICKSCNHYNKDTASVCRFCGARLQSEPVKAEDFLKNSKPVKRSNSFINDTPKGEDFLGGNSAYNNNRPSLGNTQQKSNQYYQHTTSVLSRRIVSYDNPRSEKISLDENKVRPKTSTLRDEPPKPRKSNVFLNDESGRAEPPDERHSSKAQEVKEKTAVFQESQFNKKFSRTLIFLSFITLIFIIAFSIVFIGKNYPDNSPHPSASHSAAVSSPASAKVSPTSTPLPIATTNPE